MERFTAGDFITPIWAGTFYDLECGTYRATPGGLAHVLEAEPGDEYYDVDKVYAVTLLLPDGSLRKYRSMDPRYWRKIGSSAS
jgi:hypothetical protein